MNPVQPTSKKSKQNSCENLESALGDSENMQKRIDYQQNRLIQNQQRLGLLQQKVSELKEAKAQKIYKLDKLENDIKKLKDHREMLPLIKQLREHYKKLKAQLGSELMEEEDEEDDIDVDEMTYEQLLELGEKIGKVSKGITEDQFSKLERTICLLTQQCSICQDNLVIGAECIKLSCGHLYDVQCVKEWFKMEKVCPLCKTEII